MAEDMTHERWREIERLYQLVQQRDPGEREAFLRDACAGDEGLHAEVAALMANESRIDRFIESPAMDDAAKGLAREQAQPTLEAGQMLGHYRVLEEIGHGGMGVVYKAEDSKLKRAVALKCLPNAFAADPERLARFDREARMLASLNHPNIAAIYGLEEAEGARFLVLELVEGQTLAGRIAGGPLPMGEVYDICCQIAEGLEAAHKKDIVHRDLKPANIKITPEGKVKVLDFGLARLAGERSGAGKCTRSAEFTHTGPVVGTAAYMSPEQAEGRHLDVRTDVFSFGSVLYEILTGRKAFEGDSTASIVAAVLRDNPPPAGRLRSDVPADLARVLHRCFEKDPAARYSSAAGLHAGLGACRKRFERRNSGVRALLRRPPIAVPALVLALAAITAGVWWGVRNARARWGRDVALPEAARLIEEEEFSKAFHLVRQAERYTPRDSRVQELKSQCGRPVIVNTTPPGADVYWKDYRSPDSQWELLGRSPLKEVWVSMGYLRWKITKGGYEPLELARALPASAKTPIAATLHRTPLAPGMTHVPAGTVSLAGSQPVKFGEYWLDRYEVTNRQYKEFMDRGGYRDRSYWKQEFVENGRTIAWEDAVTRFRDGTGVPGPATWELGSYPEGQQDYPVSGVSWYEAAAYAEFAGKSLPTIHHWLRASHTGNFDIVKLSNFSQQGPAPAGRYPGLSPFGNYDMAGNVKEWCWNEADGGFRYSLGGGWNEPTYMFLDFDAQSPFARLETFGFRCAMYLDPVPGPAAALFRFSRRDYSKEKPASDQIYQVYKSLYAYSRTELHAKTEEIDENSRYWRREKITFDAAYGGERMIAVLFLPRNAMTPYQTVIHFPGASAVIYQGNSDSIDGNTLDFIMRSGRALVYPIYKWNYERGSGVKKPTHESQWREAVTTWSKDLGRTVDYLETRADMDCTKLAYYGISGGATLGPVFIDVNGRFQTAVLESGGLANEPIPPDADPLNFAPRVRVPVLMLNGRFDFTFPLKQFQEPLFNLLGAPEADKHHDTFDSGHIVPRTKKVRPILEWLDRYLGPVQMKR